MMMAVTSVPELAPGMAIIAENHELRREVRALRMLMDAEDRCARREYDERMERQERAQREASERRARELSEAVERYERLSGRDPERVPYLKRIGERRARVEGRAGWRHTW